MDARTKIAGDRSRLLTLAAILYGTLGLLALAMPDALSSRLDDLTPSPLVRAAQSGVGSIAVVSNALGIAAVYRAARAQFLATAGLQRD
ncbi:MAG: hypothetical protein JO366_12930 [Methylobacteriaceae bacterium]|nr:hypothetical protein [Methylobacteriaceae bacterium]MBV9220798.1 hypothetical protein [Methylobacteriaceae bacterium]MBV9245707.1 hypothetical protein [Methylobacteriaceae bacterium]MBV9637824.1 hypothetical protein [Methylobacteriaceae bacterium]MBV9703048.1 hypothetical protein [Methylobacteriaceae bacterium]